MVTWLQAEAAQGGEEASEEPKRKREDEYYDSKQEVSNEDVEEPHKKTRQAVPHRFYSRPQRRADAKQTGMTNYSSLRTHSLAKRARKNAENIFAGRKAPDMQRIRNIMNELGIINKRHLTPQ